MNGKKAKLLRKIAGKYRSLGVTYREYKGFYKQLTKAERQKETL